MVSLYKMNRDNVVLSRVMPLALSLSTICSSSQFPVSISPLCSPSRTLIVLARQQCRDQSVGHNHRRKVSRHRSVVIYYKIASSSDHCSTDRSPVEHKQRSSRSLHYIIEKCYF